MARDIPPKYLAVTGLVILGLFAAFTLGFWVRQAGPFASDDEQGMRPYTAPRDGDHTFALNGQLKDEQVSIEYRSTFNESLDILLLDDDNYRLYSQGSAFDYIDEGSMLDTTSFKVSWSVTHADNYYWVVDNTLRPAGGAYVNDDVAFKALVRK